MKAGVGKNSMLTLMDKFLRPFNFHTVPPRNEFVHSWIRFCDHKSQRLFVLRLSSLISRHFYTLLTGKVRSFGRDNVHIGDIGEIDFHRREFQWKIRTM